MLKQILKYRVAIILCLMLVLCSSEAFAWGGGGGGRPHMATAGGKDIAKIDEALSHTKFIVESLLKK